MGKDQNENDIKASVWVEHTIWGMSTGSAQISPWFPKLKSSVANRLPVWKANQMMDWKEMQRVKVPT